MNKNKWDQNGKVCQDDNFETLVKRKIHSSLIEHTSFQNSWSTIAMNRLQFIFMIFCTLKHLNVNPTEDV